MATRGEFKVAITKQDLVFAAAHFITFAGHRCETLHGHNYRAGVVVEGGLEHDSWFVLDFSAVKRLMKRLTDELDHRVLLPRDNPKLTIAAEGDAVHVAVDGRPHSAGGVTASDVELARLIKQTVLLLPPAGSAFRGTPKKFV